MCQRDLERIDRRIDADVLCAFCRNELERYSVHDRGKILVRFDAEDKISSIAFREVLTGDDMDTVTVVLEGFIELLLLSFPTSS